MYGLFDSKTGERIVATSDRVKAQRILSSLPYTVAVRVNQTLSFVSPDMAESLEWPR
jgi:hypothetical protein